MALVQDALDRGLETQGLNGAVPMREAAYAVSAMFLGDELMSRLDPEQSEAESLFDMMSNLAGVIEQLAPMLLPAVRPTPGEQLTSSLRRQLKAPTIGRSEAARPRYTPRGGTQAGERRT